MKRSAKRRISFDYPVELVWKALMGGETRQVDTMPSEDFEKSEPMPNTMLFMATEVVENEVFAVKMKTRRFLSDMRVELAVQGPCKTRMTVWQSVEYRTFGAYAASGFGMSLPREIAAFMSQIDLRLKQEMKHAK